MKTKRSIVFTAAFTLLSTFGWSQVIYFQSVGGAGTTVGIAGTNPKAVSSVGGISSQAAGQSNRSGFMQGNIDYRPARQASDIIYSGLGTTSYTLTWTKGNGQRRIVVAKASGAVNATVTSGTSYSANAAFGSGTQIGPGNYVIYDGNGNSVTVTGLSASTVYHFKVFEYNGKYGAVISTIEYQPGDGTNNPSSRTTLAVQPTTNASGFITSSIAKDQMTIQWASGDGANRIVVMKAVSAVDGSPADGTTYTANSTFGSGSEIGTGNFVVYSGNSNSVTVTNLQPNTTYFYQVFEVNGTGADYNYLTPAAGTSQTTLTIPPVATNGTSLTHQSFIANWEAVTGASGYFLDVSTDGTFSSFTSGYQNKSIASTDLSSPVTGLDGGTYYYFRVRAANTGGSSGSSNIIQVLTVPAIPEIQASADVKKNQFRSNWSESQNTIKYFIDVATDDSFTQFVDGFNSKEVNEPTVLVGGLETNTVYFIRVRAQNASGISPYSEVFQQVTTTLAPKILDATQIGADKFVAKWESVTGATSYELSVLKEGTTMIDNYPKMVPITSAVVTGLEAETIYYYSVRAQNDGGLSDPSDFAIALTTRADGSVITAPGITNPTVDDNKVKAVATGGKEPITIQLKHRTITGDDYSVEEGAAAEFGLDMNWTDELGMEYYFVIIDGAKRRDSTDVTFFYKAFSNFAIPGFATGSDSYKMFSIPAAIGSKRVDEIMATLFEKYGGYNKKKWRMFHYQSNQYGEATSNFNTMDPGFGYWLIGDDAKLDIPVNASVINANQRAPFTMNFTQGWNQIGNPYPFNVDWETIQTLNASVGLNSLWRPLPGSVPYEKSTMLIPWEGAFVYADNGGTVTFPVKSRASNNGRVAPIPTNPDEDAWQLPVELSLGSLKQRSAFGMHPSAQLSKDKFDEITLPRFTNYLEFSTPHLEFHDLSFMIDMVPTAPTYEWKFTAESSEGNSEGTITWNQDAIQTSMSGLMLIDVENATWIDMKSTNSYSFQWKSGKEFAIAYNKTGEPVPQFTLAGQAYPNPFKDRVTIPILNAIDNQEVTVHVYDLLGRKVRSISHTVNRKGQYNIMWDGRDYNGNDTSAGMFFYRLQYGTVVSKAQRIIKD